MTRTRQPAKTRQRDIITAALRMAERHGYAAVTRDQIADAAGCSPGLVSVHFGTMPQLRRAIMGEAIRTRALAVIAQGLAARDKRAMGAPEELRREAVVSLMP